ncbi:hypothetical protein T10_3154 [Trichinella papuae]|uniref:Uncharacterized protein n=1 Tax=Trichinella papuae TaxID=268474 RepID=A0A0V1MJT8_9BILA|nr:hypothetical protein T10_3154 [Trichinella papuae]
MLQVNKRSLLTMIIDMGPDKPEASDQNKPARLGRQGAVTRGSTETANQLASTATAAGEKARARARSRAEAAVAQLAPTDRPDGRPAGIDKAIVTKIIKTDSHSVFNNSNVKWKRRENIIALRNGVADRRETAQNWNASLSKQLSAGKPRPSMD